MAKRTLTEAHLSAVAANTNVSWADIFGHIHDGALVTHTTGFDVIPCAVCEFSHLVPLPMYEDFERAYHDAYNVEERHAFLAQDGQELEWEQITQLTRLESIEALRDGIRRERLDVGFGPVFFLNTTAAHFWRTTGSEPSRQVGFQETQRTFYRTLAAAGITCEAVV